MSEAESTPPDIPTIRVVGAAILHQGKCLVTQRGPQMSEPHKWEFPGGKIEAGETPEAALEREILEELGLVIEIGPFLGAGQSLSATRRIDLQVYLAHPHSTSVRLTEHQHYLWCAATDLAALDWAAADVPIIEPLVKLLSERRFARHFAE